MDKNLCSSVVLRDTEVQKHYGRHVVGNKLTPQIVEN